MINQVIVDILVKRINNGWINPNTELPIVVGDILIEEYKVAVQEVINPTT